MASLNDAIFKLDRAKEQLKLLYDEVALTLKEESVKVGIDAKPYLEPSAIPHPQPCTIYTAYFDKIPLMTKRHGILLGEAVQSFRISLDYLAWAFAMKYGRGLGKEARRHVYYPLAYRIRQFDWKLKRVIPDPTPEQRAFFQRYQPYRRTDEGRALRHLDILSNRDKHRVIIPQLLYPSWGEINFKVKDGTVIRRDFHLNLRREIKAGTQIGSIVIAGIAPEDNKVKVELSATLHPVFQKSFVKPSPPYEITSIEEGMNGIDDVCTKIITEAKNCF